MNQLSKILLFAGLLLSANSFAQTAGEGGEVITGYMHGIDYAKYILFRVDMNLDGMTDEVFVGPASVMTHFATKRGINDERIITKNYYKSSESAVYADYRVEVRDATGDNIPDLVFISNTSDKKTFIHRGKKDGTFDKDDNRLKS